ncbi:hypothetical protein QJS10_CPB13g01417 [Acorus calamus]|uniref:Uncharacterized protein n=1 Tax=Acorus calamus TaxID=4465 RepID=A0AAV9DIB6_ACOCL|nr:hypothetical protein QJS10_CPB13g01417 [Acorus calamus]
MPRVCWAYTRRLTWECEGEEFLEETINFAGGNLKFVKDNVSPSRAMDISRALEMPLHKGMVVEGIGACEEAELCQGQIGGVLLLGHGECTMSPITRERERSTRRLYHSYH